MLIESYYTGTEGVHPSFGKFSASILKVKELGVDSISIYLCPGEFVVSVDWVHDGVVEPVEFLEQAELLFYYMQLGVVGDLEAEEVLSRRVGDELAEKPVETRLENGKTLRRLTGRNTLHHRPVVGVRVEEGRRVSLQNILKSLAENSIGAMFIRRYIATGTFEDIILFALT